MTQRRTTGRYVDCSTTAARYHAFVPDPPPPQPPPALEEMAAIGMVEEITGQKRNRIFAYREYLDILAEGTCPLN